MRRNIGGYHWTAETVATLRQLWGEAHPASEIGRRLCVSKNAVIGKARRLALPGRPSPIRHGGLATAAPAHQNGAVARTPPATAPRRKATVADTRSSDVPPAAAPATTTSPDLSAWPARECRECCWPIGEPRTAGFRLCGAPVLGRAPYCKAHSQSAYVRAQPEQNGGGVKRSAAK